MNRSKILMGAGALVLTVAGILATQASKRFANTTEAFFKTSGAAQTCISLTQGIHAKFETAGTTQAQVRTNAGGNRLVYRNNTCTLAAYFKP